MSSYQHILLAADFTKHGEQVANCAQDLVERYQANLSIIHVIDNLPVSDAIYGPVIPFELDLVDQMMTARKSRLAKLAKQLNVPESGCWLEFGSAKYEIIRVAKAQNIDLIVLGSHGRHGLALLLGSTADGVLHRAPCDVMAVRLQNN